MPGDVIGLWSNTWLVVGSLSTYSEEFCSIGL